MTKAPKYSVHMSANGSAAYARDYAPADSIKEAMALLKEFATGTGARHRVEGPAAVADVYPYDERDTADMTHGDYPLTRLVVTPLGVVRKEHV